MQPNPWKKDRSSFWQTIKRRHWDYSKRASQKTRTLFDLISIPISIIFLFDKYSNLHGLSCLLIITWWVYKNIELSQRKTNKPIYFLLSVRDLTKNRTLRSSGRVLRKFIRNIWGQSLKMYWLNKKSRHSTIIKNPNRLQHLSSKRKYKKLYNLNFKDIRYIKKHSENLVM